MADDRPGTKGNIPVNTDDYLITVAPRPSADAERRKLRRDDASFYIVVAGLILTWMAAGFIILLVESSAANVALKEWARTIFAAIVTGFIGYAFSKK